MATTYTDNTGITKPGSGEQSGTWGTTVNTNFDIIDRALNDVGAITLFGSTYTLTTNNGSLSDGQYSAIVFSGSLSGDCTVTIDPSDAAKTYIVKNSTTGGFSVILSQGNGSGGTLTVPADQVAIVYADGAGVGAKVDGKALSNVTDALTFSGTTKVEATNTGATVTGNLINDGIEVLTGGYLKGASGSTMSLEGEFPEGTRNIGIGASAFGGADSNNVDATALDNIAIGATSMSSLITGDQNVAIGSNALEALTTGSNNISVGYQAGQDILSADGNVSLGYRANHNVLSEHNIAIGYNANSKDNLSAGSRGYNIALGHNAGGVLGGATAANFYNNICIGQRAGQYLSGGAFSNILIGWEAGNDSSDQTGNGNLAIGVRSLGVLTTGDDNIALGTNAGNQITTGDHIICIGQGAGASGPLGDEQILIGRSTRGNAYGGENNIAIGSRAGQSDSPFYLGQIPTTLSNRIILGNNSITNAYINVAWTVTSDVRDKTDIEQVPHGLEFLSSFAPIKFRYTNDREENNPHGPVHYGYSAQDVLAAEGDDPVVVDTEQAEKLKMKETQLIPILHNAILELKGENNALRARLDAAGL
jgi:hypothetical protein